MRSFPGAFPEGMKEYGFAVELTSAEPRPTPEEITQAGRMIAFNFWRTKVTHPEWGLQTYEFVSGPSLEVWEYEDCATCHGDGRWWEYEMENDDVGAEASCEACDGNGRIPVRLADPPRWRHNFGWYALAPGG